jgi:integrase
MPNLKILKSYQDWKSIRNERASFCYGWTVRRFFNFCDKPLGEMTSDDVISYQSYLKKHYSDATQANAAQALRSFFDFTNHRGLTNIELREVTVPRVEEKIPVYVVQSDFKVLCDIAKHTDPYMHLAVRLLWCTGVRVSELVGIMYSQIDLVDRSARINAKKSLRVKQIFWDDETNELLEGLIRRNPKRKYVFESPGGKSLSTRQVERWIARLVKDSGINKHITPHSFRHGATKEWLNNGVDLPLIKDLLGHKSLMSIEKYTKRLDPDIKEKGREALRQRMAGLRYDLNNLMDRG